MNKYNAIRKRFHTKIRQDGNGHWIWMAEFRHDAPYFWFHGRSHNARRVSYLLSDPYVVIPAGYTFVTTCGSVKCVNPEHLQRRFRPIMYQQIVGPDPLYFYEDELPRKQRR